MLSISKAKSATSGMQYFEADSYYAKKNEQGEWFGKNANSLGLETGIEREDFRRILDGYDLEGNELVKNAGTGKRRSYVDFTFSCPKSVSVLSYVDTRIEAAHNEAVLKALKEIELNYAITREGAQGSNSYKTGNILASRFNHHESRELDPQLHSHCVIMNMTKGMDGKWRSLEMGEMFKNQLYIGQVYRNELAKELLKIGYKIEVSDRSKGLFEIAGIKHEIIDEFSTRRKQVLEGKIKYADYNVSDAKKSEMACLDSRKYKYDSDVEQIRKDTQERLKNYGTTLDKLKIDALEAVQLKLDTHQISLNDCLKMALEDITESQSAFKKEDVLLMALKNGLGKYNPDEIKKEFYNFNGLYKLGEKNIYIGKTVAPNVEYFTTKEIANIENGIVLKAERLNGSNKLFVGKEKLEMILKNKEENGMEYSEGQKHAIEMMCTSNSFINIVQGDAGSGKTFAVETFREIMNESGYNVRGFAPTGKASVELKSAKINTSTIDSFLVSKKEDISKNEIWVVDEAGMVGSRKLAKFINEAEKFNAKVILIGDSKQFTAIEQGKMFSDLQKNPSTGYAEITEVRRQKTKHMIEIVAEFKKRSVEGVKNAFKKLNDANCINNIANRDKRLEAITKDYLADREKKIDTIVLTATNRDRTDLNQSIRQSLIKSGIVESGNSYNTLQNAGLSGSKRRFADNYQPGQQIFFEKKSGIIQRGAQAEIVGLDPHKNTITIKLKDQEEHVEIDLFKDATKIKVFNSVQKSFGIGDSVITLKNDNKLNVENGKLGIIKNIDENGRVEVFFPKDKIKNPQAVFNYDLKKQYISAVPDNDFGSILKGTQCQIFEKNNKEKTLSMQFVDQNGNLQKEKILSEDLKNFHLTEGSTSNFNLSNYAYLDHAYAVTSYKSQGATVEQVRWCHDHTQKTNYNEAYVAITRAKFDAVIYTSDTKKLVEHASKEQEKESVIQWQLKSEPQKIKIETQVIEPNNFIDPDFDKNIQSKKPEKNVEKQKSADYGLEL